MRIRSALHRPGVVCLLLAIVTLAVFWPVRRADFVSLDDPIYVTANPHVQQGLTFESARWAFGAGYASNWHPLTWLSHMLDFQLFGLSSTGPHLVNLALHIANTVLLFVLLRTLTGAYWRSAMVAALFALHPLHVESVAWIAERKDVLSTLFGLLTLWAYCRRLEVGSRASGRRFLASGFYWLALLFFAFGLLAKPMLVTLPFVLLLLDYWPLGRGTRGEGTLGTLLLEKFPFFALAAVSCVMTLRAQQRAVQTWTEFSFGMRIENATVACVRYLGKTFWPVNLAVPYPHPGHWPAPLVIGSAVVVLGLCVTVIWFGRRIPFAVTGWFWFLGTLVPVIGLVQVGIQSLADRYTYVPLIGLFIAAVWGTWTLLSRWRVPDAAAAILAVFVLIACAARTRDQLRYWQNSESLFRHAIAATRNNALAHYSLGYALAEKGNLDEAIEQYQQALRVRSDSVEILENLGNALVNRKRYEEAIRCYESALRLEPGRAAVHGNLGAVFDQLDRTGEAIGHYTEALRLAPGDVTTHFRLANLLARLGRSGEAIDHYELVVRAQPDSVEARNNYGAVLFNAHKLDQAGEQFRLLLRSHPGNASAHYNLGNVLATRNQWNDAIAEYAEAARLSPESPEILFSLGSALVQTGRRDEAIVPLKEALRLKPDFAPAKQLLESLANPKQQ